MPNPEEAEYFKVFDAALPGSGCTTKIITKKYRVFLVGVLAKYDPSFPQEHRMYFTNNHDENTWNGTEYEKYGDMLPCLAVFSFTWNGMPLIYSGQEIPNKGLTFFEKDSIEWNGKYQLLLIFIKPY
ncbi:MAG: hypothetical protein IPP81_12270 [Chitinophagaceae bacterium]|nr:hypothetical protein [Chitinophagaceae bacterium]